MLRAEREGCQLRVARRITIALTDVWLFTKHGVENIPGVAAWDQEDVRRPIWRKVSSEGGSGRVSDGVRLIYSWEVERRRHEG